jgi:hypothetical protein
MALPRKDVRAAVDDPIHRALVIFAKRDGVTVAEYVEKLIQTDVSSKVEKTLGDYHELTAAGLIGKNPDLFGSAGSAKP